MDSQREACKARSELRGKMDLEDLFTAREMQHGLETLDRVEDLISLMKSDSVNATSQQAAVGRVLAATEKAECLVHFVRLDGLSLLDRWLQGLTDGGDDLVNVLLIALDRLPVDNEKSTASGIGSTVSQIKEHGNLDVRERARSLTDKWNEKGSQSQSIKSVNAEDESVLNELERAISGDDPRPSSSMKACDVAGEPESYDRGFDLNEVIIIAGGEGDADPPRDSAPPPAPKPNLMEIDLNELHYDGDGDAAGELSGGGERFAVDLNRAVRAKDFDLNDDPHALRGVSLEARSSLLGCPQADSQPLTLTSSAQDEQAQSEGSTVTSGGLTLKRKEPHCEREPCKLSR